MTTQDTSSIKYTVYQTINIVNGKQYIGKHQTKDPNDNYLGSGRTLNRAIQKYGRENFAKKVLHIFLSEDEMNQKERELVTEEFCSRKDTYNICPGGQGGFGYINQNRLNIYGSNGDITHGTQNFKGRANQIERMKQKGTYHGFKTKCSSVAKEKHRKEILQAPNSSDPKIAAKISASKRGKGTGANNSNSKTVVVEGKTYHSYKEAGLALGMHPDTVSRKYREGKLK